MSMFPVTDTDPQSLERKKANQAHIVKTAGILGAITAVEFLIAFTVPDSLKYFVIVTFIILTIAKAFYIVADFMHLKHEVRTLVLAVIVPFAIFVAWLLIALLTEGVSTTNMRMGY